MKLSNTWHQKQENKMSKEQIRKQIGELVNQYAELEYAPKQFMPGETVVPPSGKVLGAKELQYMVDASLDGWLTTGRFNEAFEKRLGEYLGVPYVLTTTSGSSANLLALTALTSPKLEIGRASCRERVCLYV